MGALSRFFSEGEFEHSPVLDTVQQITGRPPCMVERWAVAHADAFR